MARRYVIHVDQTRIQQNAKDGTDLPVFIIKSDGTKRWARNIKLEGEVHLVSDMTKNRGPSAWIETDGPIKPYE